MTLLSEIFLFSGFLIHIEGGIDQNLALPALT